ncbi:ABC transporter permease [Blattabacterium cuenoti]|uniref:ABC transporter permease n=1 Tax=Blattabacterium cuenoti TaxID=1653831 RepID=UPI00163C0506|nr:FtsX-like permease family protein [Blattabacterium cuenoti]
MDFEWFFSKKTIWKSSSKNKTFQTVVIITQIVIFISLLITIFTFSIGFGFKNLTKEKLLNIKGQITVVNKDSENKIPIDSSKIKNSSLKNFLSIDNIKVKNIYPFAENNVLIGINNKILEKFIFKGIYENYNPIFFHYFLVSLEKKNNKNSFLSNNNILLSRKISFLLGLNIGSNLKIDFMIFKKRSSIPIIISKVFKIYGLYETGIPEFDNLYIIGNIKHIQSIYGWKKEFVEGFEIFLYNFYKKNIFNQKKYKNFLLKSANNEYYNDFITWINIFNTNIIIIVFIVFISLIINMITFILILILERMKTIGILKMMGARNKNIYYIFLFYIMHIFIPPLIIGNIIGISLLLIQKKFHILSLNKMQYFIDFIPVNLNYIDIIMINLSIIFICFLTVIFLSLFFINKIYPKKVIDFE